jgi:hypothetical protein
MSRYVITSAACVQRRITATFSHHLQKPTLVLAPPRIYF